MVTQPDNLPPILPVGTRVVAVKDVVRSERLLCRSGVTGIIVKSPVDPKDAYHVQLPAGGTIVLFEKEFEVLTKYQAGDLSKVAPVSDAVDLNKYVIYRCVVGSRAYGLDHDDSDTDRRGIYLPPADMHWSLYGVPDQLENSQTDECYWELQKFLTLALKANPNVLEVLYSPMVEYATPLVRELLSIRDRFLSKLIYQTHSGYVMSQFKKIEQDIRNHGQIRWKHALHLVRLLWSGIVILRDKTVPVRIHEYRDRFLAIREGKWTWKEVNDWRLELHEEFDRASETTTLPERPDYEAANAFLIKARRTMVK